MENKKKNLKLAAIVIAVFAILIFICVYHHKIIAIATPFLMALVLAYIILPVIKQFDQRKVPRKVSILLIYATIIIFASAFVVFIIPELISNAKSLINILPEIISSYQEKFNDFLNIIRTSSWSGDLKGVLIVEIQSGASNAQGMAMGFLKDIVGSSVKTVYMVFDIMLAMIIAYYLLKDIELFKRMALSLFPTKWKGLIAETVDEINSVLSSFVKGQLLTALVVGIIEVIGLFIVNVKYPLILGLIGGFSNMVPYFGPIIGGVPAVAVALIDSPLKAFYTLVMFFIVQQIDNTIISPRIIERKLGLHPITSIFAVLVGVEFFGILGLLLSVPVTAVIKLVAKKAMTVQLRLSQPPPAYKDPLHPRS